MKFLKCLILILTSFGTLASQGEMKGNYFKDKNVYLVCVFAPQERGTVTSYHHFWNGSFDKFIDTNKNTNIFENNVKNLWKNKIKKSNPEFKIWLNAPNL